MSFSFHTGDTFELHIEMDGKKQVFRTLIDQSASDRLFVIYTPSYQGKVILNSEEQRFEVVFSKLDRSTGNYEIYSFIGKVIKRVTKDHIAMWQIERISDFTKLQRRDYFRLNIVRIMSVDLDLQDKLRIEVLSKDISAGGMRCIVNQRLNIGEPVTCNLLLDLKKPLVLMGEVVSLSLAPDSTVKYDTRIRFTGNSKKQQAELVRQINGVQAEYLRKTAATSHISSMESVKAHIDINKARERIKNDRFDFIFGYWMALDVIFMGLVISFYLAARPNIEYPLARFYDYITRSTWNQQVLYGNMWISAGLLAISLIGIIIDRYRYSGKRSINIVFIIGSFIGLLSLMVLTTLFSTVFATTA